MAPGSKVSKLLFYIPQLMKIAVSLAGARLNRTRVIHSGARERNQSREEGVVSSISRACYSRSRRAPASLLCSRCFGVRCLTSQKTAAKETNEILPFYILLSRNMVPLSGTRVQVEPRRCTAQMNGVEEEQNVKRDKLKLQLTLILKQKAEGEDL